jgi:hypothetical protein
MRGISWLTTNQLASQEGLCLLEQVYKEVLSAVLHNRGRSLNVLLVYTGALLYFLLAPWTFSVQLLCNKAIMVASLVRLNLIVVSSASKYVLRDYFGTINTLVLTNLAILFYANFRMYRVQTAAEFCWEFETRKWSNIPNNSWKSWQAWSVMFKWLLLHTRRRK